jgi:hypothetical protein
VRGLALPLPSSQPVVAEEVPVVRASGKMPPADQFLTLGEGLKSEF